MMNVSSLHRFVRFLPGSRSRSVSGWLPLARLGLDDCFLRRVRGNLRLLFNWGLQKFIQHLAEVFLASLARVLYRWLAWHYKFESLAS